jgi:hypothetical protein
LFLFLFLAARRPLAYVSFLNFTMWANLFHGLLMGVQAAIMMDRYWSKWFTDIPFVVFLALSIYVWRPAQAKKARSLRPIRGGIEYADHAGSG